MKPHSSGFGRWFVRRLVAVPTAGVFLAAGLAGASPAAGVPPAPHAAQRQTQSPPPAKSDGINWDFSVMERWHLCAPDDVNDCTLQCGRGHLPSCVYLGNIYLAGKLVPRDVVRAAEAYELPCGFAFGAACFNRAQIYAQQHDDEHAATYYARACDAD